MVFSRITSAVIRHPWVVVAVWIVAFFGLSALGAVKAADVTTDDQAEFLPSSYESARALQFSRDAFGEVRGATSMTVLVKRRDGGKPSAADVATTKALAARYATWRPDWDHIDRPADAAAGANGKERATRVVRAAASPVDPHGFQLVGLHFKGNATDPWVQAAFEQLRDQVKHDFTRAGLTAGFTGGVASTTDYADDARPAEKLGQMLLFGVAILLTAIFLRGVLAAIVPLMTVVIVGGAAGGLVNLGAAALGLTVDTSTPGLITVVLVGIGIDYFLFLTFRFREELRGGKDRKGAAHGAATRIAPVIASAALAIVIAFATLGLAQFGQLRALGPAIAVSVALMLVAGVTLMPALLAITGRTLFWPSKAWQRERGGGFASRLGETVARHPGRVALVSVAVLGVLAVGAFGARMDYENTSNAKGTESARVNDEITRALPRGATDPQVVYVRSSHPLTGGELAPLGRSLAQVDGVAEVGKPEFNAGRRAARIPVVLAYDSASERAMQIAGGPLRDAAHGAAPAGTETMTVGDAAIMADVSSSIDRDLRLIFPLAAGLILLILVALLRSVVAPVYLLAAVALEFAATLGASVAVFQGALGERGLVFTLPLVLFLFVVALGTDYNMLAAARLREEMQAGGSVRTAVATAVRHTAPAVGAAGAVLAASFGTLVIEHDPSAREMGFAMGVGILLAAIVVSSLLVPSVTALLGRLAWWPGNRRRRLAARPATEPAT